MPGGYRHAVLALGLTLHGGLGHAQELPDASFEGQPVTTPQQREDAPASESGGPGDEERSEGISAPLQSIEAAIPDLKAQVTDEERKWDEEREKRDLDAQEEMAFWAKGMFWATAATVALTFLALLAIVRTLHHTRRAADYAGDMANEAKETTKAALASAREARAATAAADRGAVAAREANEILRQEQRPWLKFVEQYKTNSTEGRISTAGFIFPVQNVGKLPARNIRIWIEEVDPFNRSSEQIEKDFAEAERSAQGLPTMYGVLFPDQTSARGAAIQMRIEGNQPFATKGAICCAIYDRDYAGAQGRTFAFYFLQTRTRLGDKLDNARVTADLFLSAEQIAGWAD